MTSSPCWHSYDVIVVDVIIAWTGAFELIQISTALRSIAPVPSDIISSDHRKLPSSIELILFQRLRPNKFTIPEGRWPIMVEF